MPILMGPLAALVPRAGEAASTTVRTSAAVAARTINGRMRFKERLLHINQTIRPPDQTTWCRLAQAAPISDSRVSEPKVFGASPPDAIAPCLTSRLDDGYRAALSADRTPQGLRADRRAADVADRQPRASTRRRAASRARVDAAVPGRALIRARGAAHARVARSDP